MVDLSVTSAHHSLTLLHSLHRVSDMIIITNPPALETVIVWHKNLMVIKFYSLPLYHLDQKLTDFNFTEA